MIRLSVLFATMASVATIHAQTIPMNPAGTNSTFDIATWNIEYFGDDIDGRGPLYGFEMQLDNVVDVISQSEIDLWALQEIASPGDYNVKDDPMDPPDQWFELIAELNDRYVDYNSSCLASDEYCGILGPKPSYDVLRVAYIYRKSVVDNVEVINDSKYSNITQGSVFGGKGALILKFDVTIGGVTKELYIINFHAAPGDSAEKHDVRVEGADRLKTHMDDFVANGHSAIMLGDFNDPLVEAKWQGCLTGDTDCDPSNPPLVDSAYKIFVDDTDRYSTPTLLLENNDINTTCKKNVNPNNYPPNNFPPPCVGSLTIDHIVHTSDLSNPVKIRRYESSMNAINNYGAPTTSYYVNSTSDHAPVFIRFDFSAAPQLGGGTLAHSAEPQADAIRLIAPSPHPFREATKLRFVLDSPSSIHLEVFDILGRSVFRADGSYDTGNHEVALDGGSLAPGTYVVRLTSGEAVQSAVIVRVE